jgi:hypothetical protein
MLLINECTDYLDEGMCRGCTRKEGWCAGGWGWGWEDRIPGVRSDGVASSAVHSTLTRIEQLQKQLMQPEWTDPNRTRQEVCEMLPGMAGVAGEKEDGSRRAKLDDSGFPALGCRPRNTSARTRTWPPATPSWVGVAFFFPLAFSPPCLCAAPTRHEFGVLVGLVY